MHDDLAACRIHVLDPQTQAFRQTQTGTVSEEQHRFLRLLGRLPARLTAEQTAGMLNCQPHDVPVLVATSTFLYLKGSHSL
jgi:hypothetical protein